ncbi:MAG: YkgJ family cysteine cluster protein [Planctomycetes bacterium]|nr:YkgJ family cysteine cluster protein [Planctomycetota bacterium]
MPPLPPPDKPWYDAMGLRFRCTACGKCCTGEPGYVWVTPDDVARIAAHKGLDVATFSRRFVRRVGDRLSLTERRNGDCAMLEDGKCSVYPAKPSQCSTFPFWDGVLESKETWAETAAKCPGMDTGDVYRTDEIDVLRRGIPEPLLDKQAAARRGTAGEREPDPRAAAAAVPESAWAAALADLDRLYADLDAELPRHGFLCQGSGDCCDFPRTGRRLFVSTLEAERFFRSTTPPRRNQDPRLCPAWGSDRACHARADRFLGCRTFFCGTSRHGDPDEVYERYYRRLKELHARHGIPWRYADVTTWAAERRPARR